MSTCWSLCQSTHFHLAWGSILLYPEFSNFRKRVQLLISNLLHVCAYPRYFIYVVSFVVDLCPSYSLYTASNSRRKLTSPGLRVLWSIVHYSSSDNKQATKSSTSSFIHSFILFTFRWSKYRCNNTIGYRTCVAHYSILSTKTSWLCSNSDYYWTLQLTLETDAEYLEDSWGNCIFVL
jgi:hypothetical protein